MGDNDSSENAEEYCEVCNQEYSDNVRPRCLVCDLTFCTDCLNNSIRDKTLVCPYCEQQCRALRRKGLDFDVTAVEGDSFSPSLQEGRNLDKLVLYNSNPDESKGRVVVSVHVEKVGTLNYETLIFYKEAATQVLSEKIHEIIYEIEDVVKRREAEMKTSYETNRNEVHNQERGSQNDNGGLSIKAISPEKKNVTEDCDGSNVQKGAKCQMKIGDNYCVNKVAEIKAMKRAFEISMEEHPIRAVTVRGSKAVSARVTVKCYEHLGRPWVHLHHLENETPSIASRTVQHKNLLGLLNQRKVTAFLDLSWEGRVQGRVYIELAAHTALAQHFKILCTGELGPSYKSTKLLQVVDKGDPVYECVIGGDYECNDGSGGRPLGVGLHMADDIYAHRGAPGIVWAAFEVHDGPKSSQFGITTGNALDPERFQLLGGDVKRYKGVFGQVKFGLGVVRKATKLSDVQSVTISDCGVVLPILSWDLRNMIFK
ncbi:uncharacterized protein [Palaemon carinicauda]